jgi:O-antigen ligase
MNDGTTPQGGQPGVLQKLDTFICRYWFPFGLAVFLSGFFWAESRHNLIVIANYVLLLPALLCAFSKDRWRAVLAATPLPLMTALFLAYMSAGAVLLQGLEFLEFFKWSFYVVLFIYAVGAAMRVTEAELERLLVFCATVAAAAGCYAIYRDIQHGTFWLPDYRLMGYGTLYNQLRSGFLFGAFATVAAWFATRQGQPRWARTLAIACAGICLLTTLFTGSRAPLLGLLSAAVWLSISCRRWDGLFLILVASAAIGFLAWDRLSERGVSLRPEIWHYVWDLCRQHPWFGDGLVRYPLEIPTVEGPKYNTHNIFLTVLYYGGLVGLVQFLAIVTTTFYLSWRDRRHSSASLLAAVLQLYSIVALQFDGANLITRPADFWVLLWLPIALHVFGRMQHIARGGANCTAR